MSLSELLVIFFVGLIVFGPNKLPMLARHLGLIIRQINTYKAGLVGAYQLVVHKELMKHALQENIQKAHDAELRNGPEITSHSGAIDRYQVDAL